MQIKVQNITLPGARRAAWLEPKRTREENRPARYTHRAFEAAEAFETIHHAPESRLAIDKDIAKRTVTVKVPGMTGEPQVYGKFALGRWACSDQARTRMANDLVDIGNCVVS